MESDGAILQKLFTWTLSENPKMRWHAVRHQGCPGDLALFLVDDPDPQVRLGALCRLVLSGTISYGEARREAKKNLELVRQFDAVLGMFGRR